MRNNLDLSITLLANHDGIAQVTGAAVDLDAVMEELLEGGEIEDFVVDGLGGVDDELLGDLLAFLSSFCGWAFCCCHFGGELEKRKEVDILRLD